MAEPTTKDGSKNFKTLYVREETRKKLNDLRDITGMMAYRIVDEALDLFMTEKKIGG